MTLSVDLVLIVIGLICFAAAAFGVSAGRVNLVAAGLFCWLLTNLI